MSGPVAESSARRPGLLRRLFLCSTGSCPFRPGGDDKALWGECTICGRRAGEIARNDVRGYMLIADLSERGFKEAVLRQKAMELPRAPSGGPTETRPTLPPACAAAPSLDTLDPDDEGLTIGSATPAMREIARIHAEMMHPAFVEPVTGYMVRDGFNRMRADPRLGACAIFMSPDVIGPEEARVEVEIRLRRVIPEGGA